MDIIESFLAANSKLEIFGVLAGHCREMGFNHCVYSPLIAAGDSERIFADESTIVESETLIARNAFANCPGSWLHRYQEARHVENDPVMKHVSSSILPICWDDASQSHPRNIVFDEAREHGLAYGMTVTVYGHNGQRALLSVSTDARPKESRSQKTLTAGLVQLMANYVSETVRKLENIPQGFPAPALSVREKDCLQWAAVGKTSWEIAQILRISERTVVFHLTNAVKKLNATNRRQAVVRALSLRLISP